MAGVSAELSEQVTCSICHDFYQTPKVLACLHRYCKSCLNDYIAARCSGTDGVVCPDCRQVCRPNGWFSLASRADWADAFPTDFLVASMVEKLKKEQNRTGEICKKHSNNPLVLYCVDCREAVCHVGAGVSHRKCDEVTSLRTEADKVRKGIVKEINTLAAKKKVAEDNCVKLRQNTEECDEHYSKAVDKTKKMFSRIHRLIRVQEAQCYVSLKQERDRIKRKLAPAVAKQQDIMKNVRKGEATLKHALTNHTDVKIVKGDVTKRISESVDVVAPVSLDRPGKPFADLCDTVYNNAIKKCKIEDTENLIKSVITCQTQPNH